jgi:hypothetical protein
LGFVSSTRFPEQQNRVGLHSDVSIFKFSNLFANAMEVDESGAKVFIQHVHNNVSSKSPNLLPKFRKLDGQECMSCSELIQQKNKSKIARKSAE